MLKILADLISFKTLTPNGDEAIDYCAEFLRGLGFECEKLVFEGVANLYAKWENFDKNLCFAGHVDVVPATGHWNRDPFELKEENGLIYGRGTNDMKGPLAAGLSAISDYLSNNTPNFSISVLLTSDEEIMGDNGTAKVVQHLMQRGENITGCVLCESCSPKESGEYIKIGCRGSLNIDVKSKGVQAHVVNGKLLGNHLHDFVEIISSFCKQSLDSGNAEFSPSDIELTSIDAGNNVRNLIPEEITAKFNIRFNNLWTFEDLEKFVIDFFPPDFDISFERFGKPFVGASQEFIDFLSKSMQKTLNKAPEIGTLGGNSDAVSIREITDVVEIGSPIAGAHIANEFISKSDLVKLKEIYANIIEDFANY